METTIAKPEYPDVEFRPHPTEHLSAWADGKYLGVVHTNGDGVYVRLTGKVLSQAARKMRACGGSETARCESPTMPPSVWALLRRGTAMQKDDDYFRELLFEMEASPDWLNHIFLDEGDPVSEKKYYHAMLLADAGALEVSGRDADHFRIRDQGYTLIGVMRDDTAWGKVKKAAQAAGGVGAQALVNAAVDYAAGAVSAAMAAILSSK